ncbi:MAG: threonylcarbamoyl-AMP synthase [Alphaproteobacteria bacterium]|nr:threonylcarbamoyl-AMP synthase [Alphaproteobacteria bacterium]
MRSSPTTGPDAETIARAARTLRGGGLVAFPTETVYGLGARADATTAIARLYAVKGRPAANPLIVHVASVDAALRLAPFEARARDLAAAFWPGPLTLVLPRFPASEVVPTVSAGLPSLAVRVPSHPVALALLTKVDLPIAAPSANRSGRVSPTRAEHVKAQLGERVDAILDAGASAIGLESTVVSLLGADAAILREGAIERAAIERVIGPLRAAAPGPAHAPGMGQSHYAPTRKLRLNAEAPRPGEAFLGFGPGAPNEALNLSPSGDLAEAAANLYASLIALDRPEYEAIAVMPIPEHGLGVAINDRLRRAAAPRGDGA